MQHPRDRVGRFAPKPTTEVVEIPGIRTSALPWGNRNPHPRSGINEEYYSHGQLRLTTFLNNAGELQDMAPGIPAVVEYWPTGGVRRRSFYSHGVLRDPSPGSPAVTEFYSHGSVRRAEYYDTEGRLHDPFPGAAAVVEYYATGTATGTVRYQEYYSHGEPACGVVSRFVVR